MWSTKYSSAFDRFPALSIDDDPWPPRHAPCFGQPHVSPQPPDRQLVDGEGLPVMEERTLPLVKVPNRFIMVGEVYVSRRPANLITVLGSCVAVCLWSAEMKLGGMNHFLFPSS